MTNAAPPTLSEALTKPVNLSSFLYFTFFSFKTVFLHFSSLKFNFSLFFQSLMEKLEKENEDEMGQTRGQSQAELCIPSQTDLFQVRI
jgi:hypothetical protein